MDTQQSRYREKCIEILNTTQVKDLDAVNVVEIDSNMGLYDGFQILLQNNIVSAPVYDAKENKYTGFLDIRDLAGFVVFVYDEQKVGDNTQLAELIKDGQSQFKTATTDGISIKYLSRRNRFQPVTLNSTLFEVCSALAAPDIHRVPVMENGKVISIISQTTIIKYLSKKISVIDMSNEEKTDATIAELKVGTYPVLSVKKTDSVINTFRKMENQQKSGIAIVDEEGRLVGTTTAKDLGLFIKNPTLQALQGNIFDYLKKIRQEQIDIVNPCITVYSTEKLSRAVGLLAATRVHRIFVVESEQNFSHISVLSISDILKLLIQK